MIWRPLRRCKPAAEGLYNETQCEIPPKSHSLVVLLTKLTQHRPPDEIGRFIFRLSEASIPTRYPDDLAKAQLDYTESVTADIISKTHEVLTWIEKQLPT